VASHSLVALACLSFTKHPATKPSSWATSWQKCSKLLVSHANAPPAVLQSHIGHGAGWRQCCLSKTHSSAHDCASSCSHQAPIHQANAQASTRAGTRPGTAAGQAAGADVSGAGGKVGLERGWCRPSGRPWAALVNNAAAIAATAAAAAATAAAMAAASQRLRRSVCKVEKRVKKVWARLKSCATSASHLAACRFIHVMYIRWAGSWDSWANQGWLLPFETLASCHKACYTFKYVNFIVKIKGAFGHTCAQEPWSELCLGGSLQRLSRRRGAPSDYSFFSSRWHRLMPSKKLSSSAEKDNQQHLRAALVYLGSAFLTGPSKLAFFHAFSPPAAAPSSANWTVAVLCGLRPGAIEGCILGEGGIG